MVASVTGSKKGSEIPLSRPTRATFVLATPPLTSGQRTLARVHLAQTILGIDSAEIVNLFPLPTASVVQISQVGKDANVWIGGRESIHSAIARSTDVVLAFGASEPTGSARQHHRKQVAWLMKVLTTSELNVWTVGGRPTHPSRWQRHTHKAFPNLPFRLALEKSLTPQSLQDFITS